MHLFRDSKKTFKPQKQHKKGTKRYDLHNFAKTTLGSGDMRSAVALPEGEDLNEWLAVHTVDFYNEVSLLYGTISDFCDPATCPTMSAGPDYKYLWADGTTIKTPIKVPAREYVDLLMTWVESQINNEEIFPTSVDVPFPDSFKDSVRVIFKRLFRVYAHIYFSHFEKIVSLSAEKHLNTCFKHFIFFVLEFELVEDAELRPLQTLIDNLRSRDAPGGGAEGKSGE